MIAAVHALIYATDAEATRAFFRDVLELSWVDAGEGWLIFALPPAELGIHPAESGSRHELSLICQDVWKTKDELESRGVEFTEPVSDKGWGLATRLRVPGAGELTLYQPRHSTPLRTAEAAGE